MAQRLVTDPDKYDIVIIGAGITGLTAAVELAETTSKSILILEAAGRPGGRAKSLRLEDGSRVDEGAHWFHGADDNQFYQYASKYYNLGELVLDDTSGRMTVWNRPEPEMTLRRIFNSLDDLYEKFAKENPGKDISLHDLSRLSRVDGMDEAAEFMATEWMAVNSAHEVSSREYFNDPLGPGGWQMKDGLMRLLGQMAQDARDSGVTIRCRQPVTHVQQDGEEAIIRLASGETILADRCLITASAGVLQANGIQLEQRIQSETHRKTKGLVMGNLTKVIVPMQEDFFEDKGIKNDTRVYMIESGVFIHARSAGLPYLTFFRGGRKGAELENWAQGRLEYLVDKVISKVPALQDYKAYREGQITTTRWASDPYTRGSYSILKPHFNRTDPFACGKIHFAGEAFVSSPQESPGQMVGAWLSAQKVVPQLS